MNKLAYTDILWSSSVQTTVYFYKVVESNLGFTETAFQTYCCIENTGVRTF